MRTLEKEIKNNGTTYSLVKRTSWKAMYRAEGGHYEVFHIEIRPEVELFGKVIPEREHYPTNEDFGKFAWCLSSREKADEIYNNLIEKKDE